jgi:uncharacterized membrane protein
MKKYFYIQLLSAIAFINAAYLSYKAYYFRFVDNSFGSSFCDLSQSVSCSEVLKHPLSTVFGISFPWIAFFVYPILFVLAYLGYKKKEIIYAKYLVVLSLLGMCFNFFIIYREMFYIYSYCILCLICTAIIISIFVLSLKMLNEEN